MKTESSFTALYKRYVFKLALSPVSYCTAAVVVLYAILQFFLGQQFFTESGTADLHYFFSAIPYISIIAIPAVAAIIPSTREELSFPVRPLAIPLAKVCALLSLFILCIAFTVGVPVAVSQFGTIDFAQLFCGYIGIVFYLLTSVSLAVFIATVVTSQSGAFITTALILGVVNSAHLIPMYINLSNSASSLLRSLSFAWHFDAAGKGIIDTRDIVFYITESVCFVLLSGAVTEFRRGAFFSFSDKRNSFFTKLALLSLTIVVLLFADNTRIYKRIDTTKSKRFTVSAYSKTLLSEAEEPLSLTYYRSTTLQQLYPQVRDVRDFLEEYASQNKNITLSVINPTEKDSARLEQYGIHAQQIQTAGRDTTSYTNVYAAIVLNYLDKTEVIPFVLDTSTLEYDLSSRISSLIRGTKRSVQIVVGNGMTLSEDYSYVKPWLESQGFTVTESILPSQYMVTDAGVSGIPFNALPDTTLLVLGTASFTSEDTEALETFILSGGKVFIATTPYLVAVSGDWAVTPVQDKVCRLLNSFGISFMDSLTADISNFRLSMYSDTNSDGTQSATTRTENVNYPLWPVLRPQQYALNGMSVSWPCAMQYAAAQEQTTCQPLLVTSSASWQDTKIDGKYETNPFVFPQHAPDNAVKGPFTIALKLTGTLNGYYTTGKGDSKGLIVLGDQYSFSTVMLNYTSGANGDFRGLDFLNDMLLSLQGQQEILSLKNKQYVSSSLYKVSEQELVSRRVQTIAIVCIIPILLIFAVMATFFIKRTKNNETK